MKTKKKVLKLRREWCFILGIITTIILSFTIKAMYTTIEGEAKKCDEKLGRTCSLYEINLNKNK